MFGSSIEFLAGLDTVTLKMVRSAEYVVSGSLVRTPAFGNLVRNQGTVNQRHLRRFYVRDHDL